MVKGEATVDWNSATVIKEADLDEYLFQPIDKENTPLRVKAYSIQPDGNQIQIDGFVKYLEKEFPKYVFSEVEYNKGYLDYDDAAQKVNPNSIESGFIGEYLLYLLTEGVLDLPVVLRKVQTNQSQNMPVHGADGFFMGEFNGKPCIAPGEAKTYGNFSNAIDKVLKSLEELLDSNLGEEITFELPVASKTNEEFSPEHREEIMRIFEDPLPDDYNILHPVVVCHEEKSLVKNTGEISEACEMRKKIQDDLDALDYVTTIKQKDSYNSDIEVILVFMFLPIPNLQTFREEIYGAIFDMG
jgi:hypothetical protein